VFKGAVGLWSVVLWFCGSVVLWFCGSVVLWFCGSVVLWFCGSVVLCFEVGSSSLPRVRCWARKSPEEGDSG
jgi:hypothetical protein